MITPATPSVSNVNAVNLGYGTALANSQLSGTASVPDFQLHDRGGVMFSRRQRQSEDVTFTPTDSLGTQHGTVDRYGQRGPGDIDGHGRWPNEGLWR